MANRKKEDRNRVIMLLWEDGKGLTQQAIADRLGMKQSAVAQVIRRERMKLAIK